jgi:hypothetical protein
MKMRKNNSFFKKKLSAKLNREELNETWALLQDLSSTNIPFIKNGFKITTNSCFHYLDLADSIAALLTTDAISEIITLHQLDDSMSHYANSIEFKDQL